MFVDRKKHMIRRSGQNISAGEVEATLRTHPAVSEVAVIPVADELRDEEVYACVILKAGFTAGAELADALARFAVEKLAYFDDSGLGGFRREPADHLFAEAPQGHDIRRSRSSPASDGGGRPSHQTTTGARQSTDRGRRSLTVRL